MTSTRMEELPSNGSLFVTQTCEGFGRFCWKLYKIVTDDNFDGQLPRRAESWALVQPKSFKHFHQRSLGEIYGLCGNFRPHDCDDHEENLPDHHHDHHLKYMWRSAWVILSSRISVWGAPTAGQPTVLIIITITVVIVIIIVSGHHLPGFSFVCLLSNKICSES